MPLFDFIDNNTKQEFEMFMSNQQKDIYLQENPHIKQLLNSTLISMDGSRFMSVRRVDNGWKDVLRKIDSRNPNNDLNKSSSIGF